MTIARQAWRRWVWRRSLCQATGAQPKRAEKLRREQDARLKSAIAGFVTARPPGGIDLTKLYEENLIDGVVFQPAA